MPASAIFLLHAGVFDGRASAQWRALGDAKIAPGGRTPPLSIGARGIPDIVSYWVIAYTPPPATEDPDAAEDVNPMLRRSVRGWTVGVSLPPAGSTAATLTARLRVLLDRSCAELGWITNAGVCHSLDARRSHVATSIAAGEPTIAAERLRSFIRELEAQHGPQPGKHVSEAAYTLLHLNADDILALL